MPTPYSLFAQTHRTTTAQELFYCDGAIINPAVLSRQLLAKWQHAEPRVKARFVAEAERLEGIRVRLQVAAFHHFVKLNGGWIAFEEETASPVTEYSDNDDDNGVEFVSSRSSSETASVHPAWWSVELRLWVYPGRVQLRPPFIRPQLWRACRGNLCLDALAATGDSETVDATNNSSLSSSSTDNPSKERDRQKWEVGTDLLSLAAVSPSLAPWSSLRRLLKVDYACNLSECQVASFANPDVPALIATSTFSISHIHTTVSTSSQDAGKHFDAAVPNTAPTPHVESVKTLPTHLVQQNIESSLAPQPSIPQWAYPRLVAFDTRRRLARLARARQAWSVLGITDKERYIDEVKILLASGELRVKFPSNEESELMPRATTDEESKEELAIRMAAAKVKPEEKAKEGKTLSI